MTIRPDLRLDAPTAAKPKAKTAAKPERSFAAAVGVAAFAIGMGLGWWWRGADSLPSTSVREIRKFMTETRRPAGKVSVALTEEEAEEPFVEAVSADKFRRQRAAERTATVEEVRDEDGLTADERVARFRREYPEEAAALDRRREARHAARVAAATKRQDFLDSVDVSFLAEDQRQAHAEYVDALAIRQDLRERIRKARQSGEAVSEDDFAQLQSAEQIVQRGAARERAVLFEAAARAAGLDDAAAVEFGATLQEILSVTQDAGERSPHRHL